MQNLISKYYQELFSSNQTRGEEVINCVQHTILPAQNEELLRDITEEEVKGAIFQMHPDKARGPDGMTHAFYQKHREIVGKDVVRMVREFFQSGDITTDLNTTNIVLIPKKNQPVMVGDLRPIALCNVLMKVITKVLANQLKKLLNMVVSDTQSVFILGRLISDNIMVSYEVMHYLKPKKSD